MQEAQILIVKKRRENYFNINPALEFGAELQMSRIF